MRNVVGVVVLCCACGSTTASSDGGTDAATGDDDDDDADDDDAAESDGDDSGDGSGDAGSSDDGDETASPETCTNGILDPGEEAVDCGGDCPTCPGAAFDPDAQAWPLPSSTFFGTFDTYDLRWATLDIDGDGRPDLVETHADFVPFGGESDPHWIVYRNDGDGFASATEWPLPSSTFFGTTDTYDLRWTTLDIDGDARPDLVETHADFVPFGGESDPHWLVYRNDGDGFAAATEWQLPASTFYGTTDTFDLRWTTLDIDGDARPDLVETNADFVPFGGEADPHWIVYLNDGDGFASGTEWPLPSSTFYGTTDIYDLRWTTLDIDGDARPDLVETHADFVPFGGATDPHWIVYRNDGDGFAAGTDWPLPSSTFFGTTDTYDLRWTTLDIDGDARPDLVETHTDFVPFGGATDPHWVVYRNDGDKFASGTDWPLPSSTFYGTTDTYDLRWTTLDIDGDDRPDLVETHTDFVPFGGDTDPHWLVYRNVPSEP